MRRPPDVVLVGTGTMAPGIAAASVNGGYRVCIVGRRISQAKSAAQMASELLHSNSPATGASVSMIDFSPLSQEAFIGASLVIETVIEDFQIKKQVLKTVERWLSKEAMLTTNTSSLGIQSLAKDLQRPEQFAGLHFLYPAQATGVLEIIPGLSTSSETIEYLAEFASRLMKTALVVRKDIPGFIWNRIQFAVLRECLYLLEEGVADISTIDAAVMYGLAPRWSAAGPFATADLGGLATFYSAAGSVFPHLSNTTSVSNQLRLRSEQGATFYDWSARSRKIVETLRQEILLEQRRREENLRRAMPSARDV